MNPLMRAFEKDTFLQSEVDRLCRKHGIQTAIETGTEYGGSANAFAKMAPRVITMDVEQKFKEGELDKNVIFLLGDSRKMLLLAIAYSVSPALFFLDAHTSIESDECPLREELETIKAFPGLKPLVIVIHDCLVPGSDFGYDTYRSGPICWEHVADLVQGIYPNGFERHYNTEASGSRRGALFIEPK